jgi:hypothetical protein
MGVVLMTVVVKTVHGTSIFLEETTDDGILPSIIIVASIMSGLAFLAYATITTTHKMTSEGVITTVPDFPLIASIVCLSVGFLLWATKSFGIFSKPAYGVFITGRISKVIPIQNDGTDQARVCIAVREFEREIQEKHIASEKLLKISRGCK